MSKIFTRCPNYQKQRFTCRQTYTSRNRRHSTKRSFFKISEEVQEALASGKPIVALETTIYTHGWPYPDNIALASRLESIVRVHGGVPATIGVVNGVATVGLTDEELIQLNSSSEKSQPWKVSRRDLGFIGGLGLNGKRLHGGTTIAGTMVLAHLAGIKIFATGGLGGVHRGGEKSMDISADLTELGRTPVTVLSSGCKSFLDIPRTLEYLETQGVGVGTFADGRDGLVDFPAFFTRDSGVKSPQVIADEAQAAAIIYAQMNFPLQSGLHFANPVPLEASMSKVEMDNIIASAVKEADEKGIHGAANTPYILSRIKELSGGRSVVANRALIESNVKRGTKVAVELAKLELREKAMREESSRTTTAPSMNYDRSSSKVAGQSPTPAQQEDHATSVQYAGAVDGLGTHQGSELSVSTENPLHFDIIVAGALASDTVSDYTPYEKSESPIEPALYTSNPSHVTQSPGGVGRNVADSIHKYTTSSVLLVSAIADDLAGSTLFNSLSKSGMATSGITVLGQSAEVRTAQYLAVNDSKKELHLAMSDMGILEHPLFSEPSHWRNILARHSPKWLVLDANFPSSTLLAVLSATMSLTDPPKIAIEPVSSAKATRLAHFFTKDTQNRPHPQIDLITPNSFELLSLHKTFQELSLLSSSELDSIWFRTINAFSLPSVGSRSAFVSIAGSELADKGIPQQSVQLLPYFPCIVTKLGSRGCLLTRIIRPNEACLRDPEQAGWVVSRTYSSEAERLDVGGIYMRLFPPAEKLKEDEIGTVNGAGDALVGSLVSALAQGRKVEDALPAAQKAAVKVLRGRGTGV